MDRKELLNKVIPPKDYAHRTGFNNEPVVDSLTEEEKEYLEQDLIQKLQSEAQQEIDSLIIDTLAYIKSTASLPLLRELLNNPGLLIVNVKIAYFLQFLLAYARYAIATCNRRYSNLNGIRVRDCGCHTSTLPALYLDNTWTILGLLMHFSLSHPAGQSLLSPLKQLVKAWSPSLRIVVCISEFTDWY